MTKCRICDKKLIKNRFVRWNGRVYCNGCFNNALTECITTPNKTNKKHQHTPRIAKIRVIRPAEVIKRKS